MNQIAPELLWHNGRFKRGQAVAIGDDGEVDGIYDIAQCPAAVRLPQRAMLPGLVNAHSHSFQRLFRGTTESRVDRPGDFWSWREAMYRAALTLDEDGLFKVARMAFLEMALCGITTVGEFHYLHQDSSGGAYKDPNLLSKLIVRAAREVGIRICLLRAAYFRAGYGKELVPAQRRFKEKSAKEFCSNTQRLREEVASPFVSVGVAPHSIRAVPLDPLQEICAWAKDINAPVHMHVSEQRAENEACGAEYGVTPIELLRREKLLDERFTAVHAIHVTPQEIDALAEAGAGVCACPTTERDLGDGIVPAAVLLERGVRVCLGSDSQAQIDLLEDARQLEYHLRLVEERRGLIAPEELFQCAAHSGAASLRTPEGAADFFTIDLDHPSVAGVSSDSLLHAIVFGAAPAAVKDVMVGGAFIVRDGRHPLSDEILDDFRTVPR